MSQHFMTRQSVGHHTYALGKIGAILIAVLTIVAVGKTAFNFAGATTTTPGATPSITLLSPNGGEKWEIGKEYEIRWNSMDDSNIGDTIIRIHRGIFKDDELIYRHVVGNPGFIKVVVPSTSSFARPDEIPAADYYATVTRCLQPSAGCSYYGSGINVPGDRSDAPFSIVAVAPERADLAPTSIVATPANPTVGQHILFDSGVQNLGGTGTGVFNVKWFLDGVQVGYDSHEGVSASTTKLDGNSGWDWWSATAGTHTVAFVVDADNGVAESNETNNRAEVTVNVASNVSLPDLYVKDIVYRADSQVIGEHSVVMTVCNQGASIDSSSFNYGAPLPYFNSTYYVAGAADLYVHKLLANGECENIVRPAASYLGQTISVRVIADHHYALGGNNIKESNESNNELTKQVTIPVTQPSITVVSPNGGEVWAKGSSQEIKWSSSNYSGLINISLNYTTGATGYSIIRNLSNTGSYNWVVGFNEYGHEAATGANYLIYVSNSQGVLGLYDESDAPFSVVASTVPVISGISGPQSLAVGQAGTWSVKASDPSGGSLTYSVLWGDELSILPQYNMPSILPQQTATFTHAYQYAGKYTPTFTVTNQGGASASASLSVIVGSGAANTPPKITGITAPTSLNVGEYSQFGFAAVDPDRDDLSWAVSWGEAGISTAVACPVSPQIGEGKGRGYTTKHAWNTPGTYRVSVRVTDCHGGEDSDTFTVIVGGDGRRTIIWQKLGWTPIDVGAAAPDDGTWYTYGDELRQDGVSDRHYKVVATSMAAQTDYEVKAVVRLRSGKEVALCGRMDDRGNGYCLVTGWGGSDTYTLAVLANNDQNPGYLPTNSQSQFVIEPNIDFVMKLRFEGNKIKGRIYPLSVGSGQGEDAWAVEAIDNRYPSGKVGLYSYGSSPVFTYLALGTSFGIPVPIPGPWPAPNPVPSTRDESIEGIERRVSLLRDDRLSAILSELKLLRNLVQEQQTEIKYLKSLTNDLAIRSSQAEEAIKNFITYGVDENTKKLGAGERAAVMHSYKSAFDKLPETESELTDAIKIANGRWPSEESAFAETRAKTEFKKIYRRDSNLKNQSDDAAVTIMAYGLRQRAENRNLKSEAQGILTFKWLYNRTPQSTEDWNIVQAITYSGAKR